MAPQPQRRADEQRKTHLDASVVPVERALLHRADELDRQVKDQSSWDLPAAELNWLAAEFRKLAEELHHW